VTVLILSLYNPYLRQLLSSDVFQSQGWAKCSKQRVLARRAFRRHAGYWPTLRLTSRNNLGHTQGSASARMLDQQSLYRAVPTSGRLGGDGGMACPNSARGSRNGGEVVHAGNVQSNYNGPGITSLAQSQHLSKPGPMSRTYGAFWSYPVGNAVGKLAHANTTGGQPRFTRIGIN
jgi:hypothetical protein